MQVTGKAVIGGVFLLAGAAVLLQFVGIHIGSLVKLVFAGFLILSGIRHVQKGKKILGGGILLLGLLFLLGAAHMFFQLLFAFLIIMLGIKWLTHSKKSTPSPKVRIKDSFDEEWNRMMRNTEK